MINTVLSPKGGTGKSTITANIAGLLADYGYKVLMVDADCRIALKSDPGIAFKIDPSNELNITRV